MGSLLQLLEGTTGHRLTGGDRELLARAIGSAQQMARRLDDMLELAHVSATDMFRRSIRADWAVDAALQAIGDDRIAALEARIVRGTLPKVWADLTLLTHLFEVLFDNSLKFRGDAPPSIRVRGDERDDHHVIEVSDNGIGMDPRAVATVFRPFTRLTSRTEHDGSGVGLAIAERIVHRHGGAISAVSTPGEGTTIRFTLSRRARQR